MIRVRPGGQAALPKTRHKAQGILEYVSLLAVVAAALLTMQLYFKMGIQAGIRSFADYIGSQKKGCVENEDSFLWFTGGVKGVRSVSETVTDRDGKVDINLGKAGMPPHYVKYEENQASTARGLAQWAVGIGRARLGRLPDWEAVDDGSGP